MDMKQQVIDDVGVDIEHDQGKMHTLLLQEAIKMNAHAASCFATPKSKRHRLPDEEALRKMCPPAPKKLRSSSRTPSISCRRLTEHVSFFVPSDLHGLPECIRTLFHN